jgi:hypothetical protein
MTRGHLNDTAISTTLTDVTLGQSGAAIHHKKDKGLLNSPLRNCVFSRTGLV